MSGKRAGLVRTAWKQYETRRDKALGRIRPFIEELSGGAVKERPD